MKKPQIGVIGSTLSSAISRRTKVIAEEIGSLVAEKGGVLMVGLERDGSSISEIACTSAHEAGGLTVAIMYGKSKWLRRDNIADIVVATGMERGGGREFGFILSCDAVIMVGGGSGTLTEAAIAYQADIPVVALPSTGGWSSKLAGRFIDERKRLRVVSAENAKDAVDKAFGLATRSIKNRKP